MGSIVGNAFALVPVSGSHMGSSTLHMEPFWLALGQAVGVAAALLVSAQCGAQDAILIHIPGCEAMTRKSARPSSGRFLREPRKNRHSSADTGNPVCTT